MRTSILITALPLLLLGAGCGDDDGQGTNNNNVNQNNQNAASCGNAVVESGEQCDEGAANSDTVPDACRLACGHPSCGDGVRDATEACDDGNTVSGDGCSANCLVDETLCGNGLIDQGELCDGDALDGQTCATLDLGAGDLACTGDCTFDTSGCCDAIGTACTTDCPLPYTCNNGICLPEGRPGCGGFAGAQCPVDFPVCLYFASSDYGPCFTAAEQVCVCGQPNAQTHFPTCN